MDNPRKAELKAWMIEHATLESDVDGLRTYIIPGRAQPYTFIDAEGYVVFFARWTQPYTFFDVDPLVTLPDEISEGA